MKKTVLTVVLLLMAAPAQAADFRAAMAAGEAARAVFDNETALAEFRKANEADPENFQAAVDVIQALVDTGEDMDNDKSEKRYEEGIERAHALVEKYPDRAAAHYMLALASGKLAQFKGGKEKVKMSRAIEESAARARDMRPDWNRPYILLGVYYREVANLSWILKAFANAFFGGLPPGTNEDSVKMLQKAIELDDRSVRAHYELGETFEVMGRKEESAAEYQKALALPSTDHLDERFKEKARAKL